jgi:hypothetical protein
MSATLCATLFALVLSVIPQQPAPLESKGAQQELKVPPKNYENYRLAAMHINQLAGNIHSQADAGALVDAIAEQYSGDAYSAWMTAVILRHVAHAEYEAVADPAKLIPEQRIANVWNEYVREINAPEETLVTVAEIHNLRDAQYTVAKMMWNGDRLRTLWTMPNIYAVGPDGKVASGARAVEAVRILCDMARSFQNMTSARDRVQKGTLLSDQWTQATPDSASKSKASRSSLSASSAPNPIRSAEYSYVQAHGEMDYELLLMRLYRELFPSE